jgi:mannosyl-3-phosphoglycerate phosphatase
MKISLIFTDLDGTLLDEHYSFQPARDALNYIQRNSIPLAIVSSKTREEIEHYRRLLNNHHPFVSENGGGIFIPKHYFKTNITIANSYLTSEDHYDVIRLGARYAELREAIKILQSEGFPVRGFGDMTSTEIATTMGLTLQEAVMAKKREFDEPFFYSGNEKNTKSLYESIDKKGLHVTKGRINHLIGQSDKGRAVAILADLYRVIFGNVTTIGLGDSLNDLPMLEKMDIAIVIKKSDGIYEPSLLNIPNIMRAEGIGPQGWNSILCKLLPSVLA